MLRRLLIPAVAAALLPSAAIAAAPAPASASGAMAVTGVWVTPKDKSRVEIYRGAAGRFYGKIVWLKRPDYPADFKDKALAGKPKVDRHNPHKSQRGAPILGLNVLRDFRYLPAANAWGKGKCYDPEVGKTYHCRMWLKDHGQKLHVRGYLWIFHRTETWTRYAAPAPATAAAANPMAGHPVAR